LRSLRFSGWLRFVISRARLVWRLTARPHVDGRLDKAPARRVRSSCHGTLSPSLINAAGATLGAMAASTLTAETKERLRQFASRPSAAN
jgi:hypothetical protein